MVEVPFRAGQLEAALYTLSLFPHSSIFSVAPAEVNMGTGLV